jgi:4-hydroxy-2-oxoheptanedioate aldolase
VSHPIAEATLYLSSHCIGNSIGYPILNGVVKPELKAAINRILEVSRKAGNKCGIYSGSGEQAKGYIEAGFDMVHIGTDYAMLQQATRTEMGTAQGKDLGKRVGY